MKITVLFENTCQSPYLCYGHGLSLYIEACGRRILFDMGCDGGFIENAKKLGIDLQSIDFAVISHGHYDHGGGLSAFMEINKTAPIYISPLAFDCFYSGYEKYIGLDPKLDKCRFTLTGEDLDLGEGIWLIQPKGDPPHPMQNGGMYIKRDGGYISDMFCHEQYLVLEENGKRVAISGCSHRGIINIAEQLRPDALVGGFHFSKLDADSEIILEAARALDGMGGEFYTCHCTGKEQFCAMKKLMPRLFYISTGQTFTL